MKNTLFICLLIASNIAYGQNAWRKIGDIKPEAGSAMGLSMAIDSNNVPYVAYNESGRFTMTPYNGVTVKKFNGTTWQFVGQRTFSGSTDVGGIDIAINRQNIPYVAYSSTPNGSGTYNTFFRLDKFNGTSWDMLIQNTVLISIYDNTALIIDRNNDPYVAYIRDANTTALAISTLGPSGASTNSLTGFSPDFAVDNNNVIYVVYQTGPFNTPFVKRYNGASWEFVGPPTGINVNASGSCRIAIDHNNVPYIVAENSTTLTIAVQKFNGTDWEQVGATTGMGMQPSIAIDNNNVPYVIYNDYRNGPQVFDPHYLGLTVKKFNGTAWELVGQRTFSTINAMSRGTSIVFGKNNVAYVATATLTQINNIWNNYWEPEAYYFGPPTFPAITLPVRLLSFEVNVVQETAVINWATATETNNDFFTIERSQDGANFTAVTRINAAGNSNSTLQYSYTDAHPFGGRSFYRLKQTDLDGHYTYSDVRAVTIQRNQQVHVFPATGAGSFTITIAKPTRTMQIEVYDLAGILLYKTAAASQSTTISLNNQAKGMYLIKVMDGKEIVAVQKIIK